MLFKELYCYFLVYYLSIFAVLGEEEHDFEDLAASIWAVIYLGLMPSFLLWTRALDNGFWILLILITTIALNDSIAMLVGKAIGKTPFSSISPNKTTEGSLAGIIGAAAAFTTMLHFTNLHIDNYYYFEVRDWIRDLTNFKPYMIDYAFSFILGSSIAFIAQVGDLLESLFKRRSWHERFR